MSGFGKVMRSLGLLVCVGTFVMTISGTQSQSAFALEGQLGHESIVSDEASEPVDSAALDSGQGDSSQNDSPDPARIAEQGDGLRANTELSDQDVPDRSDETDNGDTNSSPASISGSDESPSSLPAAVEAGPAMNQSPYYTMDELRESAKTAPQQPFWNHWLWLAAFVIFVTCNANVAMSTGESTQPDSERRPSWFSRFSLRFAIPYFVLFGFPQPLISWMPWGAWQILSGYNWVVNNGFVWLAENVLHVDSRLIPMTGSGDSTHAYVVLLLNFLVSLVIGVVWTLLDRRRVDSMRLRSLLNSVVALLLASTLVTYGMIKFCWIGNQFMPISGVQLQAQWGDCSPMGVLWRFMSTSPAYTYFAGLAELTGGILLVFRKTRLLGALVGGGAMLNVVLLNFCYDVPVKINSTHYLLMAVFLTVPHLGRLADIFVFDRPTNPLVTHEASQNRFARWSWLIAKIVVVGWVIFFPMGRHYYTQVSRLFADPSAIEGSYFVEDFELNGGDDDVSVWQYARIVEFPMGGGDGQRVYILMVKTVDERSFRGMFTSGNETEFEFQMTGQALFPIGKGEFEKRDNGEIYFSATTPLGAVEMNWVPIDRSKSALLSRGFRWINEVPYNR